MILIESWQKVFEGKIPKEKYEMLLQNGETKGLVINLKSPNHSITINFGIVSAIRILDEGIALNNLFDTEQIEMFRRHKFDGFVRKIGGELCDHLNFKHYVIVSLNFIVEIITEWEPNIEVNNFLNY